MNRKALVKLIYEWADKQNIHPDDFELLFVSELLDQMETEEDD